MNITIIGSGSWGTALAILLHNNGNSVNIWSINPKEADEINVKHELGYLPGVKIPDDIYCELDLQTAMENTELVVLAVPSKAIRSCSKRIAPYVKDNSIVVSVAKGIEEDTLKRLSEVIEEEIDNAKIVILSGPSHAEEVSRGIPTVVAVSSKDDEVSTKVADIFKNEFFRVYPNDDLIGVEVGGAVKNVIALCAGVIDGLGMGDNTKAALITRGLAELTRLGVAMGGKPKTFAGLTGIGDLVVTCASNHSRNHNAGVLIGKGYSLDEAVSEIKMVVEGVNTAKAAKALGEKYNVEMPIVNEANKVLFEGKEPKQAVLDLMTRDQKFE